MRFIRYFSFFPDNVPFLPLLRSKIRKFSTKMKLRAKENTAGKNEITAQVTGDNQHEILSDIVTPLWKLDYTAQLMKKQEWSRHVVQQIKSRKISNSKTIVHNILPSPITQEYRNKDEFSIRTGVDGNEKTVGFFIGSPASGPVVCVSPVNLVNLKKKHIFLSQVFQDFIRESELRACHDLHDGGFWKNMIVRTNCNKDTMIAVVVHPSGASEAATQQARESLKQYFSSRCPDITSLNYQACSQVKCTNEDAPFDLLHGEPYIYEYMDDVKIRISPDSFFQINTEAASILYKAVLKFAKINNRTTFLDLCCGVGTLSLLASKYARGCVGIECVKQAIEDAEYNSYINDISNCEFVHGLIENKLSGVLTKLDLASNIVAIVNPGRAGIHRKAVKVLRKSKIHHLVYISCKADAGSTLNNFVDLCSPSFDTSGPFQLTDVQAVDMFPQTNHCELILNFQR